MIRRFPVCLVCDKDAALEDLNDLLVCPRCLDRLNKFRYTLLWWTRLGEVSVDLQRQIFESWDEKFKARTLHALKHWKYLLARDIHYKKYQEEFLYSDARVQFVASGNQSGKTELGAAKIAQLIAAKFPEDYPEEWPDRYRFHPHLTVPGATDKERARNLETGNYKINQPVQITIGTTDLKKIDDGLLPKFRLYFPDWPDDDMSNEFWTISREGGHIQKCKYLPTGANIRIVTNEQVKKGLTPAEGPQNHVYWFDEPPVESLYVGALRGIMVKRGFIMITATPLIEPWLILRVFFSNDPGVKVFLWDIYQNHVDNGGPLTTEDIERLLENCDEEERECRKTGQPVQVIGSYFARELAAYKQNIFREVTAPLPKSWIVISAMDYHLNTPARILYAALNELNQLVFFDEIVVGRDTKGDTLPEVIEAMRAVEEKWCQRVEKDRFGDEVVVKNRIGRRLVDQAMDIEIVAHKVLDAKNQKIVNYSNYREFNEILSREGMGQLEKVTGAQAHIRTAKALLCPKKHPNGKDEYQPIIVGQECVELKETLPLLRKKTYAAGDMKGMPKQGTAGADKAAARGGHATDCFLYIVGEGLKWTELAAVEPWPGTAGYVRKQILAKARPVVQSRRQMMREVAKMLK